MRIYELNISTRAYNCLKQAGITTTEELCEKTVDEIMVIRNLGRKCFEEILEIMKSHGLSFRESE